MTRRARTLGTSVSAGESTFAKFQLGNLGNPRAGFEGRLASLSTFIPSWKYPRTAAPNKYSTH